MLYTAVSTKHWPTIATSPLSVLSVLSYGFLPLTILTGASMGSCGETRVAVVCQVRSTHSTEAGDTGRVSTTEAASKRYRGPLEARGHHTGRRGIYQALRQPAPLDVGGNEGRGQIRTLDMGGVAQGAEDDLERAVDARGLGEVHAGVPLCLQRHPREPGPETL